MDGAAALAVHVAVFAFRLGPQIEQVNCVSGERVFELRSDDVVHNFVGDFVVLVNCSHCSVLRVREIKSQQSIHHQKSELAAN